MSDAISDETGRSRDVSRGSFRTIAQFSRFGTHRPEVLCWKHRNRMYMNDVLPVLFMCREIASSSLTCPLESRVHNEEIT